MSGHRLQGDHNKEIKAGPALIRIIQTQFSSTHSLLSYSTFLQQAHSWPLDGGSPVTLESLHPLESCRRLSSPYLSDPLSYPDFLSSGISPTQSVVSQV